MAGYLTTQQIQLGDSPTATNNFVLKAAADGTLTIARGNIGAELGNVLRVNADGGLSGPLFAAVGTTWVNQTANRAYNTPYTNNTNKPRDVCVEGILSNTSSAVEAKVGGVLVDMAQGAVSAGVNYAVTFTVPPGASYICTGSGSYGLTSWTETN